MRRQGRCLLFAAGLRRGRGQPCLCCRRRLRARFLRLRLFLRGGRGLLLRGGTTAVAHCAHARPIPQYVSQRVYKAMGARLPAQNSRPLLSCSLSVSLSLLSLSSSALSRRPSGRPSKHSPLRQDAGGRHSLVCSRALGQAPAPAPGTDRELHSVDAVGRRVQRVVACQSPGRRCADRRSALIHDCRLSRLTSGMQNTEYSLLPVLYR